ncbi:MAG: hypothetical protein P8L85_03470 [Rubripirellula sp.]|nr:hypothetical protein [Rubripirellula sp.]
MQRWLAFLLVVCSSGIMVAEAQVVRVGPRGGVRIRAPFASVDVLPYGGGTRVRAPFTAVDTGYYRYGVGVPYYYAARPRYYSARPRHYAVPAYPVQPLLAVPAYPAPVYPEAVYPAPIYPEAVYPSPVYPEAVYPEAAHRAPVPDPAFTPPLPQEAARPIVGVLEDRLRASALRLQYSLSLRRDDGDVWQNYLAPQTIVDMIDQGLDPRTLRELLRNYNGILANPALASIRNAAGFNETRRLLQQFIDRRSRIEAARSMPGVPPQSDDIPSAAESTSLPAQEPLRPANVLSSPIEDVTTPAAEIARPAVPVPL